MEDTPGNSGDCNNSIYTNVASQIGISHPSSQVTKQFTV